MLLHLQLWIIIVIIVIIIIVIIVIIVVVVVVFLLVLTIISNLYWPYCNHLIKVKGYINELF